MERTEIRVECLKLAHRHDRTSAQIISDAKDLEGYVYLDEPESNVQDDSEPRTLSKKERRRLKSSGNSSILT